MHLHSTLRSLLPLHRIGLWVTVSFSFWFHSASYADIAPIETSDLPNVTILADSSLTDALTEIIRLYSRERNITTTASFDETAEQAHKITDGEAADIFISAHPKWMTDLKQQGLIDVFSIANLIQNRLVLVSSTSNRLGKQLNKPMNTYDQLVTINSKSLMVLSDPDNTALGIYSKDAITNIGMMMHASLWNKMKNTIIRSSSAKDSLYLITHGNRTGIVYASDAFRNKEVVILSKIDQSAYEPIIYQAAVVAGGNMDHARELLEFLRSKRVLDIYIRYGFSPLN